MKVAILLSLFCALATGQRITTIQLDGVQYFISRMNPYSPELNYFLAYQYCRSLGLQLASFETIEKVESMSHYLKNAGYSKYDFWTSGNRLGTGMFLWMSTGLPFNATFDYFDSANNLDPIDHNSNTTPQRTARTRNTSSGLEKGCVMLQAPSLRWAPEDCSAVKDFICEQTRCYYYNYGSIPVSSTQGRPLIATMQSDGSEMNEYSSTVQPQSSTQRPTFSQSVPSSRHSAKSIDRKFTASIPLSTVRVAKETSSTASNYDQYGSNDDEQQQQQPKLPSNYIPIKTSAKDSAKNINSPSVAGADLKEVEKYGVNNNNANNIKSIFSLADLMSAGNNPSEQKFIPQIDSDYSNTMRVLGQTTSNGDNSRTPLRQTNHALY